MTPYFPVVFDGAADRPSLDLNFAALRQLDPRITFSRASSATFIGPTGLVETAATGVPRFTHDPVTGQSLGLLVEEARTNLLLNSSALVTQNVTVTAVAHTLSFTGTGTVTLSGASTAGPLVGVGTGEANRVRLTFTPTAGTLTVTVSGAVNDAQLEAGPFATSYIPTTGSTALRAADVAAITGTNFSQWYRQNQGTLVVDVTPLAFNTVAAAVFSAQSASSGLSSIRWEQRDPNWLFASRANNTDVRGRLVVTGATLGARAKLAVSYSNPASVSWCANAGTVGTASSVESYANDRLILGFFDSGTYLNGAIARIRCWPRRLPDTQLQRLTAL